LKVKKPQKVLLENVKGMLSKTHKKSFDTIISQLKSIGYNVTYQIINSNKFKQNPQNRERVWIYGDYDNNSQNNPINLYEDDQSNNILTGHIKNYVDIHRDENLYLTNIQIMRLIQLHNLNLNVTETLCIDIYNKKIKYDGSCQTITEPHHNTLRLVEVPLIDGSYRVSKLSVKEHFRLMGFEENEIIFDNNMSYNNICSLAGNGWDINVVEEIFTNIYNLRQLQTNNIQTN
jgi:DNA (cytosine-5)-methyltransferase 1